MFQIHQPEIRKEPTKPLQAQVALVFHSNGHNSVVSRHSIKDGKIRQGTVVSMQHTMALVKGLAKTTNYNNTAITLNDPNLLFESVDRLVWFKPSVYAPMWFSNSNKPAISHKVNWPNLIIDVNKRNKTMRICATATSTRPTLSKKVYLAPLWNLSSNGSFCLGAARLPDNIDVGAIAECEACIFDSQFTHSNTSDLFKGDNGRRSYLKKIAVMSKEKGKFKASDLNVMDGIKHLEDWLGA